MSSKSFRLTQPVVKEHNLQEQIAHLLAIEIAPAGQASCWGVLWFSIDHANAAGLPALRTRRGIVAGVPDVFVQHNGRSHWIELKTAVGRVSASQRDMAAQLITAGSPVAVARDGNDVLRLLDQWGVPRHRRTTLS